MEAGHGVVGNDSPGGVGIKHHIFNGLVLAQCYKQTLQAAPDLGALDLIVKVDMDVSQKVYTTCLKSTVQLAN